MYSSVLLENRNNNGNAFIGIFDGIFREIIHNIGKMYPVSHLFQSKNRIVKQLCVRQRLVYFCITTAKFNCKCNNIINIFFEKLQLS